MGEHHRISPSSFARRAACPGSLALEETCPDSTSEYTDEGTAAHQLLQWTLESEAKSAYIFQGRIIRVVNGVVYHTGQAWPAKLKGQRADIEREFEVDSEMCGYVQEVVEWVLEAIEAYRSAGATSVELFSERKVNTSHMLGVDGAFGTVDITVVATWPDGNTEVLIGDLKYGRGVQVMVEDNEQLIIYGGSVAYHYMVVGTVNQVRMVIFQPRLGHVDETTLPWASFEKFRETALSVVKQVNELADTWGGDPSKLEGHLHPSVECKFCKAKATCPAVAKKIITAITEDELDDLDTPDLQPKLSAAVRNLHFADNERLAKLYPLLDMISDFPNAVLARIESELFKGNTVEGVKLVAGKRGARRWNDAAVAETTLKNMRYKQDEMYSFKLISPSQAEKLIAEGNPRRWAKLQPLIIQPEGKPSVAPISDKRPPLQLQALADDLDVVAEA